MQSFIILAFIGTEKHTSISKWEGETTQNELTRAASILLDLKF